jgi:hypothetical protein
MVLGVENPVPVPNDVPWYWIMSLIIAGGAVTVWGFHNMAKVWLAEPDRERRRILALCDLLGLLVCVVAGGVVGGRVWDTALGACCGLAGGFGYQFFMRVIRAVARKRGALNGNGDDTRN